MIRLLKSRKGSRSIVLLTLGLLASTAPAQAEKQPGEKEIYGWISQLADPSQRDAATKNLCRAGRKSARPLANRLQEIWLDRHSAEEVKARRIVVQILFDLGADAVDSLEQVVHFLTMYRGVSQRPELLRLLGQLVAYNPRAAIRTLDAMPDNAFRHGAQSIYDFALWGQEAGQYDLITRLDPDNLGGSWQQQLAIGFISVKGRHLLANDPIEREALEDEILSMMERYKFRDQAIWRSLTIALARLGSRNPAASSGHAADLSCADPRRRVAAAHALARFEQFPTWVMAALIASLDDHDPRVASEAVTTLGIALRHTPGGIGALEAASRHKIMQVRRRAKSAIETLQRRGELPKTAIWWWADGSIAARGPLTEGLKQGRWEFFRADGSRRSSGNYQDGLAHGPWTFWHTNSKLAGTGSFDRGHRSGNWITRYENGSPETEGSYKSGFATGTWTAWHANGSVAWAGEYRTGKRHGHWVLLHPNRELLGEGDYASGRRIGKWAIRNYLGYALSNETVIARLLGEPNQR